MKTVKIPTGYVLAAQCEGTHFGIVLARESDHDRQYVTWQYDSGPGDPWCYWGHYGLDVITGLDDFTHRSKGALAQ